MSSRDIVAGALAAIRSFVSRHRKRGALAIVLQPFFNLLPLATRVHLAASAMIEVCGATMAAKDRWGEAGNVIIDGSEFRVGVTGEDGALEVRGRGKTSKEAFAEADGLPL